MKVYRLLPFLVFLPSIVFSACLAQEKTPPPSIKVDPRLILEAQEAWKLIGTKENPVWPGWDASSTPLLFYLPGVQDVLIGHPHPPDGFVLYRSPFHFLEKPI